MPSCILACQSDFFRTPKIARVEKYLLGDKNPLPSEDFPLGGSVEPYDIEIEKSLMNKE